MRNPFKNERKLGISRGKRRYDLPLNRSAGTGFLMLLIALMTFLAVLALASSFALSAMTSRWSSGLENKVTVEIPAENKAGKILPREEITELTTAANNILKSHPSVHQTSVMTEEEIGKLIEPWLGDNLLLSKVPLPGLISVELVDGSPKTVKLLESKIQVIAPQARIDMHEQWLNDLLKFTGALQFAAAILSIVIGFTTITAVAGGVRSRMAVHHEEVELLHLMGAHDSYISKQFQRHSMILAAQGALIGMFIGLIVLFVIRWLSGEMGVNLLPNFTLSTIQISTILALPALIAIIATVTARQTVLKVLTQMP